MLLLLLLLNSHECLRKHSGMLINVRWNDGVLRTRGWLELGRKVTNSNYN